MSAASASSAVPQPASNYWIGSTLAVALVGVAGSLWLSIGMDLWACALCFYQRAFVMGVAAVLAVGLVAKVRTPGLLSILSLPLAIAGLIVAAFHVNLVRTNVLECPEGILEWGTAPSQSLCVYLVLTVTLCLDLWISKALQFSLFPIGAAVVLGILMAIGCLKSNPPPKVATAPDQKLNECRKPYVEPGKNP